MSDARESKLSVSFYNPCESGFSVLLEEFVYKSVAKDKSERRSKVIDKSVRILKVIRKLKLNLINCLKFVESQIMVYCLCRPSVFVQEFSVVYTGNGKWTHFSEPARVRQWVLAGMSTQARSRREGACAAVSDQHGRAPASRANIGGSERQKWQARASV